MQRHSLPVMKASRPPRPIRTLPKMLQIQICFLTEAIKVG